MPEESAAVISAPTETLTQSTGEQPSEVSTGEAGDSQPTAEATNWAERVRTDADLQRVVQEEANRLAQKWRARDKRLRNRALAKEATTHEDESVRSQRAQELAAAVAAEEDPEETLNRAHLEKARAADSSISALRRTVEYSELWNQHGKAEMDRRWNADPEEFADWIAEQIVDMRAAKRAKSLAKDMSKAEATDLTNERLRNLASPIAGSSAGGVGGMTLDRLLTLPFAQRTEWKKSNPQSYDQLVAEAAAG